MCKLRVKTLENHGGGLQALFWTQRSGNSWRSSLVFVSLILEYMSVRYSSGSIPSRLHEDMNERWIEAALPPASEPMCSTFLRTNTHDLIVCSQVLLSISKSGSLRKRTSASQ